MKKNLLLFLLILFISPCLKSQTDSIPRSLIISEIRTDSEGSAYIEFTNMGDTALDLSRFFCKRAKKETFIIDEYGDIVLGVGAPLNDPDRGGACLNDPMRNDSLLDPGESFVTVRANDQTGSDGQIGNMTDIIEIADMVGHKGDGGPNRVAEVPWRFPYIPEWEYWGFDSIDSGVKADLYPGDWMGFGLYYMTDGGRFPMVDQFGVDIDWASGKRIRAVPTVAGIVNAGASHTSVRKFSIKEGNTDWPSSTGVDLEDSEWIPLEHVDIGNGRIWSSVGNHGNYSIDFTSSIYTIDHTAGTITVPWGTNKYENYEGRKSFDQIIDGIDLGPGMAWQYQEKQVFEDSAYWTCRTGDTLVMYAFGDNLETKPYRIIVSDPANDNAKVYPKRRPNYPTPEDPSGSKPIFRSVAYSGQSPLGTPYYVTQDDPEMDTIGNIPFATPVDTLQKYLLKAPASDLDFVWVDDQERVSLKDGDILKVTAENGTTTKEYYIKVDEYEPSDNTLLAAITWPDRPEVYIGEGWMGDTIPGFQSGGINYTIKLPYGTTEVPALQAIPDDLNATISVARARLLSGTIEDRTTTITVTSESDTLQKVYTVIFGMDLPPEMEREFVAEPFISKVGRPFVNGWVEICNPGNVSINLSNYMIVKSTSANPNDAISEALDGSANHFDSRYKRYVPGYKFTGDEATWLIEPGILINDPRVNPIVNGKDVFLGGQNITDNNARTSPHLVDNFDVSLNPAYLDPMVSMTWPEEYGTFSPNASFSSPQIQNGDLIYLFKILNDSILNGEKFVGDPDDFELIDAFGDPEGIGQINGNSWNVDILTTYIRKPHVSKGVTDFSRAFGVGPDTCEWVVKHLNLTDPKESRLSLTQYTGSHTLDLITAYMSTVKSESYKVSVGFESPQTIQGDMSGTIVSAFYQNLIKADPDQTFNVLSGADGTEKGENDAIAGNDTLVVLSADSSNTTSYVIVNSPLSSNAVLVAKDESGLVVAVEGETGTISGMPYTQTLKTVVGNLEKPALATWNLIDENMFPVPMTMLNFDTSYVDVQVHHSYSLEVIAEDGTTIMYSLAPTALASDAFVTSSKFTVDQDLLIISGLPGGFAVNGFYDAIKPVKGATATLIDEGGIERESGNLVHEDKLEVVSEDQTKTVIYYLTFFNETNPDYPNSAPVVDVAFADTTIEVGSTISVSASATDDGVPTPAALSYTWSVITGNAADVIISNPNQLTTDVAVNNAGSYTLEISVSDGELATKATVAITAEILDNIEAIETGFRMYPNPASDAFTLEFLNMNSVDNTVKIFNYTGKAVFNGKTNGNRMIIDVSTLDVGVYFVIVAEGPDHFTQKLFILR